MKFKSESFVDSPYRYCSPHFFMNFDILGRGDEIELIGPKYIEHKITTIHLVGLKWLTECHFISCILYLGI